MKTQNSVHLNHALRALIILFSAASIVSCVQNVVGPPGNAPPTGGFEGDLDIPPDSPESPQTTPAPVITGLAKSVSPGGETLTYTVSGRNFGIGSKLEVRSAGGKLVWRRTLRDRPQQNSSGELTVSRDGKMLPSGSYVLQVVNSDGKKSARKGFKVIAPPSESPPMDPDPPVVEPPEAKEKCEFHIGLDSEFLFLGGGKPRVLLEKYLSQGPDVRGGLSRKIEIRFYQIGDDGDLSLRKVKMDSIAVMFVESQADYIDKLIELLPDDGEAAHKGALSDEARKMDGAYFQCLPSVDS